MSHQPMEWSNWDELVWCSGHPRSYLRLFYLFPLVLLGGLISCDGTSPRDAAQVPAVAAELPVCHISTSLAAGRRYQSQENILSQHIIISRDVEDAAPCFVQIINAGF